MKGREFKRIWGKPWDFGFLLKLEQHKIREMIAYFKKHHHLSNWEFVVRDMQICDKLISIVLEEDKDYRGWLNVNYGESGWCYNKEKIKYVYNWMGNNTSYDKTFTWSSKNQSVYSVFMSKEAVCAGFAKASQIIFQNIGIESYGVAGQTGGPHMWNIIEYDGKYYFFDSTCLFLYSTNFRIKIKKPLTKDFLLNT